MLATIITGVIALALGFFVMGYLWMALDLNRPLPEGVDEDERNMQLFILWMGIPLSVLAICGVVMIAAVVVAGTVMNVNLPH
ncbi:MAG: hypothetical protein ABR573_02090 [Candidatus Dormibacteria bacterium]